MNESTRQRTVGGPLITGLSLMDNLLIEHRLAGTEPHPLLLAEFVALMQAAGCPLDLAPWADGLADSATPLQALQLRLGRAWLADPEPLCIDRDAWDDAVLPRQQFEAAFHQRHPWRTLRWTSAR